MVQNRNKFQVNQELERKPSRTFKREVNRHQEGIYSDWKQHLIPLSVIAFLIMWVSLCMKGANPVLINKALICSCIIMCVLFLKSADEHGDWDRK